MFSLFLPPKIASAVRRYGDVTIFDASASFSSLSDLFDTDESDIIVRTEKARTKLFRRKLHG